MDDLLRDQWIKSNLPSDAALSQDAVKILMRLAYEEGRKRERKAQAIQKEEDTHGPAFI